MQSINEAMKKLQEVRVNRKLNRGDQFKNPNGVIVTIIDVDEEHLLDGEPQVTYRFEDSKETKCYKQSSVNAMLDQNRYKAMINEDNNDGILTPIPDELKEPSKVKPWNQEMWHTYYDRMYTTVKEAFETESFDWIQAHLDRINANLEINKNNIKEIADKIAEAYANEKEKKYKEVNGITEKKLVENNYGLTNGSSDMLFTSICNTEALEKLKNCTEYIRDYLDVIVEDPQTYQNEMPNKLQAIYIKLQNAVDELDKYWTEI